MVSHQDLAGLNRNSAKIASFLVRVKNAEKIVYTEVSKKTRIPVTAYKFEAHLVGEHPESYCIGCIKGTQAVMDAAFELYVNDSVWILSKVAFDTAKQGAYVSTPIACRVDLEKSTLERSETDAARTAKIVVPPRTVAETSCIKTSRATDLMAMIKEITPMRTTTSGKKVADVTLIDESKASDGKLATVMVGVWGEAKVNQLRKGQTMVFFNLSVSVDGNQIQINHWEANIVQPAPDCSKAQALRAKENELTDTSETNMLTMTWTPTNTRDVSGLQPLSCAAFLDFTAEEPKAKMPEAMQVLWLHLEEPEPSDSVMENTGQRLWYRTILRDVSGAATVGVPEKQALKLASVDTVANFLQKHEDGALSMPLLCNARVSRTTQTGTQGASQPTASEGTQGASQPTAGEAKVFVNHTVEEIEAVSWDPTCAPNASYNDVIHILNNCPSHDEGLLFAFLADIKPDPYCGFKVLFGDKEANRAKYVVALIGSPNKSQTVATGSGWKVTTAGITDIANTVEAENQSYQVTGYCSQLDIMNFKLDPPRGKACRVAVVLLTGADAQGGFDVHKLELVEPESVKNAIACFRKLRFLTKKIAPESTAKRTRAMENMFLSSPKDTKRCKTLHAVPSDVSLKEE